MEGMVMGHENICDCPFKDHCAAFDDPLIDDDRKGSNGLGCRGQNDIYRGKHCRKFACAYLSMVVSDGLRQGRAPDPLKA